MRWVQRMRCTMGYHKWVKDRPVAPPPEPQVRVITIEAEVPPERSEMPQGPDYYETPQEDTETAQEYEEPVPEEAAESAIEDDTEPTEEEEEAEVPAAEESTPELDSRRHCAWCGKKQIWVEFGWGQRKQGWWADDT